MLFINLLIFMEFLKKNSNENDFQLFRAQLAFICVNRAILPFGLE
jgi:hypothetical protein